MVSGKINNKILKFIFKKGIQGNYVSLFCWYTDPTTYFCAGASIHVKLFVKACGKDAPKT